MPNPNQTRRNVGDPIGKRLRQDADGLWLFENASVLGADSSGRGNSLTNNNSVSQVAGKVGSAANFVGASSQTLSLASAAPFVTSGAYALAFWMQVASFATQGLGCALTGSTGNTGNWDVHITTLQQVRWDNWRSAGDTTARRTTNTTPIASTNTWYHVALVWDGSASHIWVNAVEQTLAAAANPGSGWVSGLRVGALDGAPSSPLTGKLDEFGYWPRAISQGEIVYMYASGAGRRF